MAAKLKEADALSKTRRRMVMDAELMLDAGADLLQAYTAFIYNGPAWPGRINRALATGSVARATA